MIRLFHDFLSMFRAWELSARLAFLLALVLLVISLILMRFGPAEIRQPALVGFVGLIFASQVIFMWGNRHMVTSFTRAQRRYRAEDFEGARLILERLQAEGKADAAALTLLANTYRQLGMLDASEQIVRKALLLRPSDPFPLYSLGRTLLVQGKYNDAILILQQAIEAGAPELVEFDLGEALYRAGNVEDSRTILNQIHWTNQEAFRRVMTDYLLYRIGDCGPPAPKVISSGLVYWQSSADRFQQTPYGQALAKDVAEMQRLMEGT